MSSGAFTLDADDPQPGESHAGCVIERLLGQGTMGSVYLARRQSDGAAVVVKFLATDMARNPSLRARFQREWEALRKIHPHPNVVQVLSVDADGERPCIVLEYVAGAELTSVLADHGRLEPRRATEIARDMARGLAVVHAHGLIHRDVKPANVMVTPSGGAKIVDFGLAKDLFMSGLTKPGTLLGTAQYMAPEQWEDEGVDARCDVFSLGATLYHLLTGSPPFDGADLDEVADRCLAGGYTPLREVVPHISPELELVVAQALMTDRPFRYPGMKELAEDLESILAGGQARVPCLVDPSNGARYPLTLAEWFTVGSDSSCAIPVRHPSVSPKHAQVRRQATGYVLRDLKSVGGTRVAGATVKPGRARTLKDGERITFGKVRFVFKDPLAGRKVAAFLEDVERSDHPVPIVRALEAVNDPRTVLALVERLAPDRYGDELAVHHLTPLLGADVAGDVAARRAAAALAAASAVAQKLTAITGLSFPSPNDWISWWHQVRTTAPPQVGPSSPRRALRLRVTRSPSGPIELPLDDLGLVFIGRDEKCQLRLDDPSIPRLLATVLRLHRRLVVVDEGSPAGTMVNGTPVRHAFLDPGDTLTLGGVEVVLEATSPPPEQPAPGVTIADEATCQALEAIRHPSVAAALVHSLGEPNATGWAREPAADLFPEEAGKADALGKHVHTLIRARAELAASLLPQVLGADAGRDVAAWNALLLERSSALPPQVIPRGWIALAR